MPGRGYWGARPGASVPTELNEREISVIVGSMLGDGHLGFSKRSKTAVFTERKTATAAPYLEWKAKELARLQATTRPDVARIGDRFYNGSKLSTLGCLPLNDWHKVFYNEDKTRRVGQEAIKALNALVVAVWLQDDGTLPKMVPGMHAHPSFVVCSERFPRVDQEALCDALQSLLSARPKTTPRSMSYRIYFGVDATRRMAELTAPYWHPCMAYKFPYPELLHQPVGAS